MCLLVLAWRAHPRYRLVVAANRDEFHERPAAALAEWPPPAQILGGRDLRAGGTWLAIDRARRFGVVTNFRELQPPRPGAPSRGGLIPSYLGGSESPPEFFAALESEARHYSGFNLLLADREALWYGSNRASPFARALAPGVYALSNEFLDTPWPKVQRARGAFEEWLKDPSATPAALFALLRDPTRVADDGLLPNTGVSRAWERVLSSPFVLHPEYGTRCSTVLLADAEGGLYLAERRFDERGEKTGETQFDLAPLEWP
ncbi:MAG TPA: NRDE family protein [Steroidobacteraceae bacterium]|nr:NRDE family protein [Steroidobacteraceae bacterium]